VTKASSFIVTISMMTVLLLEPLALAGGGQGKTRVKKSKGLTRAQNKKNTYLVHLKKILFLPH
jgi:hypothetical protein